jgi:hypothetical protein
MRRQQSNPYLVAGDKVHKLQHLTGIFKEDQLQKFIFSYYQSIPIDEIEPAFGPLIPVCRELPTNAGPIDAVFINHLGLPTLVECKLWENPEARRKVVGQILDYAKELSQWSYDDLQTAASKAQGVSERSLYELISHDDNAVDERDFVDNVSRNLRRGRFLLLIIGDGIRENVEQITDFLQKYAHLNFSLALVELGIFKLPNQNSDDCLIIQPRLVAQTIEIVRAVLRIEDGQIISDAPIEATAAVSPKRIKISEQVFFETLKADATTKAQLKAFFEKAQDIGLYVEPGSNSMILKSSLFGTNFGVINANGYFYNCAIVSTADAMGQPQIGEEYLNRLAELLNEGIVKQGKNRFDWTVKVKSGKGDRYATVAEVMAVQDKWLEVIQKTLAEISKQ